MGSLGTGLLVGALAVLAAASCHFPQRAPKQLTCVQEVCATLLEQVGHTFRIEVTAPERAVLHQALLVPAGASLCRAGTALVELRTETLLYPHGPAPIGGTHQLTLRFDQRTLGLAQVGGEAVDLDVRTATGGVCVRVPFLETGSGERDGG